MFIIIALSAQLINIGESRKITIAYDVSRFSKEFIEIRAVKVIFRGSHYKMRGPFCLIKLKNQKVIPACTHTCILLWPSRVLSAFCVSAL